MEMAEVACALDLEGTTVTSQVVEIIGGITLGAMQTLEEVVGRAAFTLEEGDDSVFYDEDEEPQGGMGASASVCAPSNESVQPLCADGKESAQSVCADSEESTGFLCADGKELAQSLCADMCATDVVSVKASILTCQLEDEASTVPISYSAHTCTAAGTETGTLCNNGTHLNEARTEPPAEQIDMTTAREASEQPKADTPEECKRQTSGETQTGILTKNPTNPETQPKPGSQLVEVPSPVEEEASVKMKMQELASEAVPMPVSESEGAKFNGVMEALDKASGGEFEGENTTNGAPQNHNPDSSSSRSDTQCSGENSPSIGRKTSLNHIDFSKYNTVSYRKIRKGNTRQRIDEFESMMHT